MPGLMLADERVTEAARVPQVGTLDDEDWDFFLVTSLFLQFC